jgi:opacity protein-like surface antigen
MKNIVIAVLLSAFVAVPAVAADGKNSIGVNYGLDLDGVIGIQGVFDISASMPNKAPVSVQVFWKNYSQSFLTNAGTYQYSYNGFGAAAIYDFSPVARLDKRIKPYAGLGLITLSSSLSGPNVQFSTAADSGGLYITGGVQYALTPALSADLNLNNYGGLTIGANFIF